ncbi:MAG: helix-turn-helix domain-containing protein, partial [Victivallales bacterium]|nr:helix-turn-helix domain-containing protein [Victivallales bacterium]
ERIILAPHRDLQELQRDRKFRKDLYYRISTHHIEIPPLRERRDDIVLLLEHFVAKAAKALKKKKPTYPDELITLLKSYHFPGNIRELESMVFDAVSRHESKTLSTRVFNTHMKRNSRTDVAGRDRHESFESCLSSLEILPQLKEFDQALVKEALRRSNGNQSIAAGLLGITPQALSSRLRRMKG